MQLFSLSNSGTLNFAPDPLGIVSGKRISALGQDRVTKEKEASCLDDHIEQRPPAMCIQTGGKDHILPGRLRV